MDDATANGLKMFTDKVRVMHDALGYFPQGVEIDLGHAMATLHLTVAKAFQHFQESGSPTVLLFVNRLTGEIAKSGEGVPSGFAVDLAEAIFDAMGILRSLNFDVPVLLTALLDAQTKYALEMTADVVAGAEDLTDPVE